MADQDKIKRTARAEIQRLEAELSTDPRYQRLQAMKAVLEAYSAASSKPSSAPPSGTASGESPVTLPAAVAARQPSRAPAIVDAAIEYLKERQQFTRAVDIAAALSAKGMALGRERAAQPPIWRPTSRGQRTGS